MLLYFFWLNPKKSNGANPVDLMNAILSVIWTFVTIFFVCELGEKVTHDFNLFYHELCNCDWFLFPIEMKRIYLIVLVGAEQAMPIQGYANTTCTRDTFKNVNKIFFFCKRIDKVVDCDSAKRRLDSIAKFNMFNSSLFPLILDCQRWIFLFHNAPSNGRIILEFWSLQFINIEKLMNRWKCFKKRSTVLVSSNLIFLLTDSHPIFRILQYKKCILNSSFK